MWSGTGRRRQNPFYANSPLIDLVQALIFELLQTQELMLLHFFSSHTSHRLPLMICAHSTRFRMNDEWDDELHSPVLRIFPAPY